MNVVVDVLCWVIIGSAILFVLVMTVSLCIMAGKYDDISEEYWNEYWGKDEMQEKAQKKYEEYREKFANTYGKTLEEATECVAVKNYKAYLEKEYQKYGVHICEKVGDA